MLSGLTKVTVYILLFPAVILLLTGCGLEKQPPQASLHENLKQGESARLFLQKSIDAEMKYGFYLPLLANDTYRLCYLEEEDSFAEWGIRFVLAELQDTLPVKVYTSPVMDGSLKESAVRAVRLPGYTYDLLFYNSGSYFLGSGGGEIYSYLADFEENTFSPGFLEVNAEGRVTLSMPSDIPEVMREFFVKEFRLNYPSLTVEEFDAPR